MSARPWAARLALAAVVLYPLVSASLIPAFMVPMRERLKREAPAEWAKVVNDGSFAYASPFVLGNHLYEDGLIALRVRQVFVHGYPYDPYTRDTGADSWVFGALLSYLLALFWLAAGGNPEAGMVLAGGATAAVKTYALFRLYEHVLRDRKAALFAAPFTVFFSDSLVIPFQQLHGALEHAFAGSVPGVAGILAQLPRRVFNPMWVQDYARMPSVALTWLLSAGALTAAYRLALSERRRTPAALLAGLAVGLLGLANVFEWALTGGAVACFLALAWGGLPPAGRRNLALLAAAAALACAAYGLWAWSFMAAGRSSIIHRTGDLVRMRPENLLYLAYAGWFWQRARRDPERAPLWLMGAAVEASVFLLCASPLVLGFDLSFSRHLHMHANLLMAVAALAVLLARRPVLELASRHAYVLAFAVFSWDVAANKSWSEKYFKLHGAPAAVEASMRWVDANTPPGSLVVTLSHPALYGLARWTRARTLVSHHSPTVGHPGLTTEENLRRFAVLLKAADVDLEAFLRERWFPFEAERDFDDRLTFYARNHALDQRERTDWPFFLIGEPLRFPGLLEESAGRVRAAYAEAAPLAGPFYLWLRRGEERFLLRTPESRGGRRVYEADGVSLYEFR